MRRRINPAPDYVIQHLADKAMALSHGDLEGTVKWLQSLGATDIYWGSERKDASVTGLTGMRVGLIATDPVTCAVQLGFALAGPFWPQVYPGILEEMNRRWKEERFPRTGKGPNPKRFPEDIVKVYRVVHGREENRFLVTTDRADLEKYFTKEMGYTGKVKEYVVSRSKLRSGPEELAYWKWKVGRPVPRERIGEIEAWINKKDIILERQVNPLRHTSRGWYWGSVGPQPTREKMMRQVRAIYASGYRGRNPRPDYGLRQYIILPDGSVLYISRIKLDLYAKKTYAILEYLDWLLKLPGVKVQEHTEKGIKLGKMPWIYYDIEINVDDPRYYLTNDKINDILEHIDLQQLSAFKNKMTLMGRVTESGRPYQGNHWWHTITVTSRSMRRLNNFIETTWPTAHEYSAGERYYKDEKRRHVQVDVGVELFLDTPAPKYTADPYYGIGYVGD